MSRKKIIGDYGEKIAVEYLIRKGYNILDSHFSGRFGEIDIVAAKDGKIHFVEVKTRTNVYCGAPEEAMTNTKIKRLLKTCKNYMYKRHIASDNYQLDLIAIELNPKDKKAKIRHYKAIQPRYLYFY